MQKLWYIPVVLCPKLLTFNIWPAVGECDINSDLAATADVVSAINSRRRSPTVDRTRRPPALCTARRSTGREAASRGPSASADTCSVQFLYTANLNVALRGPFCEKCHGSSEIWPPNCSAVEKMGTSRLISDQ